MDNVERPDDGIWTAAEVLLSEVNERLEDLRSRHEVRAAKIRLLESLRDALEGAGVGGQEDRSAEPAKIRRVLEYVGPARGAARGAGPSAVPTSDDGDSERREMAGPGPDAEPEPEKSAPLPHSAEIGRDGPTRIKINPKFSVDREIELLNGAKVKAVNLLEGDMFRWIAVDGGPKHVFFVTGRPQVDQENPGAVRVPIRRAVEGPEKPVSTEAVEIVTGNAGRKWAVADVAREVAANRGIKVDRNLRSKVRQGLEKAAKRGDLARKQHIVDGRNSVFFVAVE